MDIKEALKNIPTSAGVYLFYNDKRRLIYVGKASNLKKRVSSYVQKKYFDSRIESMISKINSIDYIPTSTSAEALIYESSLIKEKKPKYNVAFRDDKSYPYLKLTVKEQYPRLLITRKVVKDGSSYYGPYTNAKLLRQAVSLMKRIFPLRTCEKIPRKPCLSYDLAQCIGPCIKKDEKAFYKDAVKDIKFFLKGKKKVLLKRLSKRMDHYSEKMQYEKALRIRNQIEALSTVVEQGRAYLSLNKDLEELKELLNLKYMPARIEAFDISNISGYGAVGSMVTFFNGLPLKKDYRRFRIKTVSKIDDYAMIGEVIRRRCSRLIREKKGFPDVILIDGGKGHLNTALDELKNLGLKIPIISIAKRPERIYVKDRSDPISLSSRSKAFRLMQRIRDEAHRFALSYQKIVRKKELFNK